MNPSPRHDRVFVALIFALVTIGIVARVAPLFDRGGRVFQQFPTEDGYLMLQIARNIALGNGMGTAEGTLPTNGTQPLATMIWAACFYLVDAARKPGVILIQGVQIAVSLLCAGLLYRLSRRLLGAWALAPAASALAAATWYAGHMTVHHTQNCLETSIYAMLAVSTILAYASTQGESPGTPRSIRNCVALGFLLGLTFLARNDASLLILSVCLAHWLLGIPLGRAVAIRRLGETILMGATSVAVASPWLIHNQLRFGHIVPISGIAESHDAVFAGNLYLWPTAFAEYLLAIVPVPLSLEGSPLAIAGALVVIAIGMAGFTWAFSRAEWHARRTLIVIGLYALFLSAFYALVFGVGFFMNRYLFPLSPFLAILWAGGVCIAWQRLRPRRVAWLIPASILVVVIALNARVYRGGDRHMHWQVVSWVEKNVPDDVWVGAIQTGTLGFFHDRTINLDGKVNPEALEARLAGRVPEYAAESAIEYLVDWDLSSWMSLPGIAPYFELIVHEKEPRLTVLKRTARPQRASPG